jgi:hypothetical protein
MPTHPDRGSLAVYAFGFNLDSCNAAILGEGSGEKAVEESRRRYPVADQIVFKLLRVSVADEFHRPEYAFPRGVRTNGIAGEVNDAEREKQ